jgi:hypothetical protein
MRTERGSRRFDWSALGVTPPTVLAGARNLAHHAAQWPTAAARANLAAEADDGHTSLAWDDGLGALLSRPIPGRAGELRIGVRVAGLQLIAIRDGTAAAQFALDGETEAVAGDWVDAQLRASGLAPASGVVLPYAVADHPVTRGERYDVQREARGLAELGRWFGAGHAMLAAVRSALVDVRPGAGPVRVWPHHFDVATLVRLEEGDPEHARSIGIGLSPGDAFYAQPYAYVSPYPPLSAADLPRLPRPGHWHTHGFVGAVATAEAILALPDRERDLHAFLAEAFDLGRARLGI